MKLTLIDILMAVLFAQLVCLSLVLILDWKKAHIANRFLGFLLLAKALCVSNFLSFRLYDWFYLNFPHSFYFGSSFSILWGPLLYFYCISVTNKSFKFERAQLLHFLPSLLHFSYFFLNYHIYNAESKRALLQSGTIISDKLQLFFNLYQLISYVVYLIFTFIVLSKYRNKIKHIFSNINAIELRWLLFVVIGFSLKWFLDAWFTAEVYFFHIYSDTLLIISRLTLIAFVNYLIYMAIKRPVVYGNILPEEKHRKPVLSKSSREIYYYKLTQYMVREKPFCNPDITITDISEQTHIPIRSLSETLNEYLKQNFYDFINSYRIEESVKLLSDPESPYKTVLEVMYEVGFNNKTSFYNAFRKKYGMTPNEFKKTKENRNLVPVLN